MILNGAKKFCMFNYCNEDYLQNFFCRFVLPPFLTLKNFEGLDLGKMDQVSRISYYKINTVV